MLTSQWCRTTETAELGFPGRSAGGACFQLVLCGLREGPRTGGRCAPHPVRLERPRRAFISTHQINITALTQIVAASDGGVIRQRLASDLAIVGRLRP